jgi:hypothetical protein
VAFVRTWTIGSFDFPNPSTEEHLEVALGARSDFPNVTRFVAAAVGVKESQKLVTATPIQGNWAGEVARDYLSKFAGIELPLPCDWPTYDLGQGPDEIHLVIAGPEFFIRYHWSTSA